MARSFIFRFVRLDHMEYFKIGKFVASFGLKGELVLKHNLGKKSSLKGIKAFFIEENKESFLPWFVESTRIRNEEEVYLKLEGVEGVTTWVGSGAERFVLVLDQIFPQSNASQMIVMPRDMKWSSPSAVERIASSTVAKPCGRAISTPATKLGIT